MPNVTAQFHRLRCRRCVAARLRRLASSGRHKSLWRDPRAVAETFYYSFVSDHPVRHSDVVNACIDVEMIDVVEHVNRAVCPTRFSCQGGPVWKRGPIVKPMITVTDEHFPTLRQHLTDRGVRVAIAEHRRVPGEDYDHMIPPEGDYEVLANPGPGVHHVRFTNIAPRAAFGLTP